MRERLAVMYELLEHPADIGFRAFGGTLAELFANAALALVAIGTDPDEVQPAERYELSAEGSDRESLLVNWLSEVLYWFDGRRIAFREFHVELAEPAAVRATALGEPRDPARHHTRLIVKAVTWHQLRVVQTEDGWICEVYLDI